MLPPLPWLLPASHSHCSSLFNLLFAVCQGKLPLKKNQQLSPFSQSIMVSLRHEWVKWWRWWVPLGGPVCPPRLVRGLAVPLLRGASS